MQLMLKYIRICYFFATFLTFATSAVAQPPSKPASPPDYTKEAAVVELYSTKATFENDGTGTRESTTRVRLQSDAGVQRFGLLAFSYQSSSETLDIGYVRVHKPDGTIVETPTDSVQDMATESSRQAPMYSDQREKHIAVKGLGTGDVLEFQVLAKEGKPLVPGQFWYGYNFSHEGIVLQEQLQISIPHDRVVKWKSSELKPSITEEGGRRVFTWTGSHLQSKTSAEEDEEKERAVYRSVRGLFPAPEVQISTFQSWEDVGRWYGSLQKERVQPGPEVRAKAAELTKGTVDEDAKILAIYNYVSTQYRYIGIAFGLGRFQPHSATEVLSNQYGDCKDKHTLLASLLQAVGIAAYPALISSGNIIDPDVPSVSQFNHVITVLPRGNNYLWLDTTSELAPLAYLLPQLRDKQALVIPTDHPPLWITTPADPPFPGSSVFKAQGQLSEAGVLDAQMAQTLRGDLEILIRTVFRRVPQPQWKDLVQQLSLGSGFGGTVSDVVASSPEATGSAFKFSYNYNRKDYSDWENRRITPPFPAVLMPPLRDDQTKFLSPLWLGAPGENDLEATIKMPEGYSPELPKVRDVIRDFAEYHASYELEKGVLTAKRRLVLKLREVPVSEFEEYKSFRKAMEDEQNQYVVLTARDSSASLQPNPVSGANAAFALPDSDNPEAMHAESQLKGRLLMHDLAGAMESLRQAVAADPEFTRAWALLAELDMDVGKPEESIDALHHAINSDPKSPIPRKLLASALTGPYRHPDEAITAWRELLKLNPQDHDATQILGGLFISQKRFAEAISLLDAAARENPSRPDLQVSLGNAYLLSGDREKAMPAFNNAVKMSPGAAMKNEVGYALADANARLPEALQYAKEAVQEEETASRNVHLEKLEVDDLGHTRLLAAYWDTLGWVYFRMANLHEAETCLFAAFHLSQDAVIADHLGQVYQEEHKPDAAIRMYRLALAQTLHPPETQERLDHLAHAKTKSASAFQGGAELSQMRTTKVGRLVPGSASAEFFFLFAPGSKVADVRFISGSETLRTASKTLSTTAFNVPFPAGSDARVLRRGILGCYPTTGCTLVMLVPSLVVSIY
jgi:tetratricopeptide (TPR) repeat protein